MKIIIDMNLSPEWVSVFDGNNIDARHWSHIGKHNAPDREIMNYAKEHGYIILPTILILETS